MTLTRLDQRYGSAVRSVWASVLGRTNRSFLGLGSWRDADAVRFRRTALPIILSGERQVAALTASYHEQLYREVDPSAGHVGLDLDEVTGAALRGVDPNDVYERPFKEIWTALSDGVPLDDAVDRGTHRLETLIKTDLQLSRTHTVQALAPQFPKFEYTIRVLQGEYDCALCMIASTQRYRKRDLAPIHPGCDCLVKLVTADEDPGQVIDEEKLDAIHKAVDDALGTHDRGGRAVDYRQILISNEHGEIGPVLSFGSHKFTGPDDIGDSATVDAATVPIAPAPATPRASISDDLRTQVDSARSVLPSTRDEWTADRMRWDADVGQWVFTYRGESLSGNKMPPEKYEEHLDRVLDVGRSMHGELIRAMDEDKELQRLRESFDALGPNNSAEDIRAARQAIARRESEFVHAYISSVREMGGDPPAALANSDELGLPGTGPAPTDWEAQLKESFKHFPAEWLNAMQGTELRVIGSERAFYSTNGDVMALSTWDYSTYDGAFSSGAVEVAAHELGHRMEQYIPGLKQLEYTFVRRRNMVGDGLRSPQNIANLQPHYDPAAREMTYDDHWADPYTGKTYEMHNEVTKNDPAGISSEVFQVGLQDLYGRGTKKFGDDELQAFVLAVLALL
jgi:hypothetical protein